MINSIKGKKRKNKRFKIVNNEQDGRFKSKLINCYIKQKLPKHSIKKYRLSDIKLKQAPKIHFSTSHFKYKNTEKV